MELQIPEEKRAAIETALRIAFNASLDQLESIALLTGGLSSALVYRIMVGGKAYVMRVQMHVDALNDPTRQLTCMNIAAQGGVAPRIYYASAEDAISIIDFINTASFPPADVLVPELARTVKTLHALPAFPPLVKFLDGVDIFIQNFMDSKMLPESATAEHFRYYAQIQQVYPRHDPDQVASHNDLNRNNILFDGNKIWFIDWDAAFLNDRYVDLAIASKFAPTPELEKILLGTYFGGSVDDYKRARFFLMQQVCNIYYAMVMLRLADTARPNASHDVRMDTPTLREVHIEIGAGKLSLATYEGQMLYGKTLLNETLGNMKTPRFAESVRQVEALPPG